MGAIAGRITAACPRNGCSTYSWEVRTYGLYQFLISAESYFGRLLKVQDSKAGLPCRTERTDARLSI